MAMVILKIKAVYLILLLAGQEASRIRRSSLVRGIQSSIKLDDPWNEADKACTWNLFKSGCTGDGCQFRPLILDKSLSESCRLSDASMLNPTGLDIAAQVFEEKSKQFQNDCVDAKPWEIAKGFRCQRRAGRMLRSTQLLSMAAQLQKPMSPKNSKRVEHALNNIASAFGTDGQHILELKDKLKGDLLNFAKDPTGKIKTIIETVPTLLAGSESDKEQAKHVIRDMPSSSLANMTEKDKKEIEDVAAELVQERDLQNPEVAKEAFSNLDNLVSSEPNQTEVTALLQTDEVSALIQTESNSSSQFIPLLGLLSPFRGGGRRRKGSIFPSRHTIIFNLVVAIVVLAIILVLIGPATHLGALVAVLSGVGTIFLGTLVLLLVIDLCKFIAWLKRLISKRNGNTTTPPSGVAAPYTTTAAPGVLPPGAKFDPITGNPLKLPPRARFDLMIGKPLKILRAKFDPMTGKPLTRAAPPQEPTDEKPAKGRGRRGGKDLRKKRRRSLAKSY